MQVLRERLDLASVNWTAVLGECLDARYLSKKPGPCPVCGGTDRYVYDQKKGPGSYFCRSCGPGDAIGLLAKIGNQTRIEVIKHLAARKDMPVLHVAQPVACELVDVSRIKKKLQATWDAALQIVPGDPVSNYLSHRVPGIQSGMIGCDVRYHPALEFWHEPVTGKMELFAKLPAMLLKVRDGKGVPISIHRTYLTRDGRKANVPTAAKKQMTGTSKLAGGAVRLMPVKGVRMGVAEGAETAWACSTASGGRLPVWSSLNAGNLSRFVWPEEIRELVIFEDHDAPDVKTKKRAGEGAAAVLERRARAAGLRVIRKRPETEGEDFCDVWQALSRSKLSFAA